MIFHLIKVAKDTWEPCCHLEAETGSWFTLIEKALVIFIILHIIYYQELVIMSGAGWVGAVYKTYISRDGQAKQGCQIM